MSRAEDLASDIRFWSRRAGEIRSNLGEALQKLKKAKADLAALSEKTAKAKPKGKSK